MTLVSHAAGAPALDLGDLLAHVSDAVMSLDADHVVQAWNRGAERTYGLRDDEVLGRRLADVLPTDSGVAEAFTPSPEVVRRIAEHVRREGEWEGRLRQGCGNREFIVDARVTALRDATGAPIGTVWVNRDITETLTVQRALRDQELIAQSVLDALPSLTLVVDSLGMVVATNVAWQQFQSDNSEHVARVDAGDDYFGHLRAGAAASRWMTQALAGLTSIAAGRMHSFEMDYDVVLDSTTRTFSMSAVPLPSGGLVVSHVDITWRKSLERQLSHRATHDALTGLPNRMLLTDRLVQALHRAARTGRQVAVLFCDLDQFKVLNDTLGHAAGDEVIVSVARRLQSVCRASDSVTRFGGDEFVIVVEDVSTEEDARAVAKRLLSAVTAPMQVEGVDLWFGTSIGVVLSPGDLRADAAAVDGLLRDADTAMYRAKDGGRNQIVVFDPSMREKVATRLALTMSLRQAIARDELHLDYQPQFSCRSNRVVGAEALLRWRHPHKGVVHPSDFIEAAEESGLIVEIGAWALEEACRQAREWSALATDGFSVSVNVSPRQLASGELADQVADCLRRYELDPARLTLELTESALVSDPDAATSQLAALSDLGVWIAVDDFGTGYSSLAYLQRFPVDALKIDRSFIGRLVDVPKTSALVHGIVDLAHALGLLTVAEGIEHEEQRLAVARAGCDTYQGYLAARPGSADDVTQLLLAQR